MVDFGLVDFGEIVRARIEGRLRKKAEEPVPFIRHARGQLCKPVLPASWPNRRMADTDIDEVTEYPLKTLASISLFWCS